MSWYVGSWCFRVVCVFTGSLHVLEKKWTYSSLIRSDVKHPHDKQQQQRNSHPVCRIQNIWTWAQGSCRRPQETPADDTMMREFILPPELTDTDEKIHEEMYSPSYCVLILRAVALLMESLVSWERRRNQREHKLTLNLSDSTDTESPSPSDQQPDEHHQNHRRQDNSCSDSHCDPDQRWAAFFSRADERKKNCYSLYTDNDLTEIHRDDPHL